MYVPTPDSELVARLYMYLQSTMRKMLLLSCGWIVKGSFTSPVGVPSTLVIVILASAVGQVVVSGEGGDGTNVSVNAFVAKVARRHCLQGTPHGGGVPSKAGRWGVGWAAAV